MNEVDSYLQLAKELAWKAGSILRTAYNLPRPVNVDIKDGDPNDLVTETDRAIEDFLVRFIGEETSQAGKLGDDPTWIIDPIDGTVNFVYRIPYCCVSIGLWIDKKPIIAVIHNPILNETYTACAGNGAFLNNKPIRTSINPQRSLSTSLLICQRGIRKYAFLDTFACRGVLSLRSAALEMCQVARGAADAFILTGIKAWDMAAAVLIVQEAGGIVSGVGQNRFDLFAGECMACADQKLHAELRFVIDAYLSQQ